MKNIKFRSFLVTKPHIVGMIKAMKSAGLRLEIDWDAGTVEAFYGKTSVYQAIEKGCNQPWLVRHAGGLFE